MLKGDVIAVDENTFLEINAAFHTTNQHAKGTVLNFYDTGQ